MSCLTLIQMNFLTIRKDSTLPIFTSLLLGAGVPDRPIFGIYKLILTISNRFLDIKIYSPRNHPHHQILKNYSSPITIVSASMDYANIIIIMPWKVFTMPLAIEDVPVDQKVLCSDISPKINPYGEYMCNLHPNYFMNVSNQIWDSDFGLLFGPVISDHKVCYIVALSASFNIIGWVLDVTNIFQNTTLDPKDIVYIMMPTYLI